LGEVRKQPVGIYFFSGENEGSTCKASKEEGYALDFVLVLGWETKRKSPGR
jgi:hypothetical protein